MKNIHFFTFIVMLVGINHSAFGMFHTTTTIKPATRTYFVKSKLYDPKQGRREAYQAWYNIPINWDNVSVNENNNISYKESSQNINYVQPNAMNYYRQFIKK